METGHSRRVYQFAVLPRSEGSQGHRSQERYTPAHEEDSSGYGEQGVPPGLAQHWKQERRRLVLTERQEQSEPGVEGDGKEWEQGENKVR